MELLAARVLLLLLLLGLLCGGGVVAVGDCESTFSVRGAANQLAAAAAAADCTTHAAHLATGGGTTAPGLMCDPSLMASQLTQLCRVEMDAPGALCCAAILMTVEQDNCLCSVAEAAQFDVSDLSVPRVWEWYKSCGGRRRSVPRDDDSCKPGSPPPPPPPPPAKPEAPSASPLRLWIAVGLLCAAAVATAVFAGLKLWLPRKVQVIQGQNEGAQLNLGQHQDLNEAAMTGLPEETATAIATGGSGKEEEEEEEVSPPVSPMGVEERSQLARARLPSPIPFKPSPPPPVVPHPPEIVIPIAHPVIMAY